MYIMKKIGTFCAALFLVGFNYSVLAQSATKANAPVPVRITGEVLDFKASLSDPRKAYNWLKTELARNRKTDSFSSSTEVEREIAELKDRFTAFGPIGFQIPQDISPNGNLPATCKLTFHPNVPELEYALNIFGFPSEKYLSKPTNDLSRIPVWSQSVEQNSYIGQNSFGARVEVGRTLITEVSVATSKLPWTPPTGKLALESGEARSLIRHLNCALTGILNAPFVYQLDSTEKPTLEYPYETKTLSSVIFMSNVSLILFDKRTGRIVSSTPITK